MKEFEKSVYSQNGEDGIIEHIFSVIGTLNKYFVEFGIHPNEGNTLYLKEKGWNGLWMDQDGGGEVIKQEPITAGNINELFKGYKVPHEFDLLSIDIDGNDYYVWEAIESSPRVVVIEYNSSIPANESKTIFYDPDHVWKDDDYYGASLLALDKLGRRKGYTLLYCEANGVNAFFVRSDLVSGRFKESTVADLWVPPGWREGGWPASNRLMREV